MLAIVIARGMPSATQSACTGIFMGKYVDGFPQGRFEKPMQVEKLSS
jgi:hypothetical protein